MTPGAVQWQPAVFKQALRGLGYEEPTNLIIVVRDATGRLDMLPQLAGELVREQVDVIVAISTPGTILGELSGPHRQTPKRVGRLIQ